jgi:hypothetical protein
MQLGVWRSVVSRFQAAALALVQSVAPATGMFVVLPQFVNPGFCSMATDHDPCARAGPVKTASVRRAKTSLNKVFMTGLLFR